MCCRPAAKPAFAALYLGGARPDAVTGAALRALMDANGKSCFLHITFHLTSAH